MLAVRHRVRGPTAELRYAADGRKFDRSRLTNPAVCSAGQLTHLSELRGRVCGLMFKRSSYFQHCPGVRLRQLHCLVLMAAGLESIADSSTQAASADSYAEFLSNHLR